MSINPVSNVNNCQKIQMAPQTKAPVTEPKYEKPKYTGKVSLKPNGDINISTWIPMSFDSNVWYTLTSDGRTSSMSCWGIKGNEAQNDGLKALYQEVSKEIKEKGSIEGERAMEILDQIKAAAQ